jgi:hypothetical protein
MSGDIMDRFWSAPPVSRYTCSLSRNIPSTLLSLFEGGG